MEILGIDIGGTGIKGAPVDTETGRLLTARYRVPTPPQARPLAVAECVADVARHFAWEDAIGCGFPAAIRYGTALTAANIHRKWIGRDVVALFGEATGCPVCVINDADAAGIAEMTFGAGKGRTGVVMVVTIGTGIGTAIFTNGQLLPNTEFGHIEIRGKDAETRTSDTVRKRKGLSWRAWAKRLDEYLCRMERLIWPELIILGGGAIKEHERFFPFLTVQAEVVPAQFMNEAGIVGAALAAENFVKTISKE